jgi:hypothetical protein
MLGTWQCFTSFRSDPATLRRHCFHLKQDPSAFCRPPLNSLKVRGSNGAFTLSAFLSAVGLAKEDQRLPSQPFNRSTSQRFSNLKCLGRGDVLRPLDPTPISD